jgi:hypothetical protein
MKYSELQRFVKKKMNIFCQNRRFSLPPLPSTLWDTFLRWPTTAARCAW